MDCGKRTELLEQHATAMLAYTKASIKWQELTKELDALKYQDSRNAREQARLQVDLATDQLEQHERLHCYYPLP